MNIENLKIKGNRLSDEGVSKFLHNISDDIREVDCSKNKIGLQSM